METEVIAKIAAYKAYALGQEAILQGRSGESVDLALQCLARLRQQPQSALVLRPCLFYTLVLAELHRSSDPSPFREAAVVLGNKLESLSQHSALPHYMKIVRATDRPYTTGDFGDIKTPGSLHTFGRKDAQTDDFETQDDVEPVSYVPGLFEHQLRPFVRFLDMPLHEIAARHGLITK